MPAVAMLTSPRPESGVSAVSRLTELTYNTMSDEQKRLADTIFASRTGRIIGPMNAWLRSPKLAERALPFGQFCRWEAKVDQRLRELAIIVVARHWSSQIEWGAHKPEALQYGIAPSVVDAIEERRQPVFERHDEAVVYAYVRELLETRAVCDATYDAILGVLGEQQLVELIAVIGHYNHVAMVANTFHVPVPEGLPRLKG